MITHVGTAIIVRCSWNIQLFSPDLLSGVVSANVLFVRSCKNIRINMCQHSQSMQHNKSNGWQFLGEVTVKYVFITVLPEMQ